MTTPDLTKTRKKSFYATFFSYPAYYRCGPITTRQSDYDAACTRLGNQSTWHDFGQAFRDINEYADRGLIDSTRNLNNKPLYVYTASRNWLFNPDQSYRIVELFEPYIGSRGSIRAIIQEANNTLPTNRPEFPPCVSPTNRLFLSNCGFSGALDALQFLLGRNAVRDPNPSSLEPLLAFDQTEFFYGLDSSNARTDMDTVGYLYIPKACQENVECFLHFYFHGCSAGRQFVGAEHITNSGYLEVAEANGIIMVFPQAQSSLENDIGCWDTYGFTGPLYATKRGAQVTVIRNMLARILKEDRNTPFPEPSFQSVQSRPASLRNVPRPSSFQTIQTFPPQSSRQPFPPEFFSPRGPPVGASHSHTFDHGHDAGGIRESRINQALHHPPPPHPGFSSPDYVDDFFRGNADVFRYLENFPGI